MRNLILFTFKVVLSGILSISVFAQSNVDWSKLREIETDWGLLSELDVKLEQQQQKVLSKRSDIYILAKAKVKIIEGDLALAKFLLSKIDTKKSNVAIIKKRYLALIYFIEGKFEKVLTILDDYDLNESIRYRDICMLKVISLFSRSSRKKLSNEFNNCTIQTYKFSPTEHLWLDNLMAIKMGKPNQIKGARPSDIQQIVFNNEIIKIWLKTGIYTNKEYLIKRHLADIPGVAYKSKRVRELISLIHYRLGNKKEALSFIEDISSPNAENIKGNINLENKEYELAFGHFMLALKKKANSTNALERAMPLSWILGNWDDGIKLLERIVKDELDPRRKLTLDTVFRIRKDKIIQSRQQISLLENLFKNKIPFEIEQMKSYVALREFDNKTLIESSHNACRSFDGLNCWIHMQTGIWDNLGKTVTRDQKIDQFSRRSLASLKKSTEISEMKEIPFIDQRDIEELDSALVTIKPL